MALSESNTTSGAVRMQDLPDDVLEQVFSHLDVISRARTALVCVGWAGIHLYRGAAIWEAINLQPAHDLASMHQGKIRKPRGFNSLKNWLAQRSRPGAGLKQLHLPKAKGSKFLLDAVSKEASLTALVAPVYAERNLNTVAALGSTLRLLKVSMLLHDSRQLIQTFHHLPHLQVFVATGLNDSRHYSGYQWPDEGESGVGVIKAAVAACRGLRMLHLQGGYFGDSDGQTKTADLRPLTALTCLILCDVGPYGGPRPVEVQLPTSLRHLRMLGRHWSWNEQRQPFWVNAQPPSGPPVPSELREGSVGQHTAADQPALDTMACELTAWRGPPPQTLRDLRLRVPACSSYEEAAEQHRSLVTFLRAMWPAGLRKLHLEWYRNYIADCRRVSAHEQGLLAALPPSLEALSMAGFSPRGRLMCGAPLDHLGKLSAVYSEELVDDVPSSLVDLTALRHLSLPAVGLQVMWFKGVDELWRLPALEQLALMCPSHDMNAMLEDAEGRPTAEGDTIDDVNLARFNRGEPEVALTSADAHPMTGPHSFPEPEVPFEPCTVLKGSPLGDADLRFPSVHVPT